MKYNSALNLAPFGRWTLRDKATQRRGDLYGKPETRKSGVGAARGSRGREGEDQSSPFASHVPANTSAPPSCTNHRSALAADVA